MLFLTPTVFGPKHLVGSFVIMLIITGLLFYTLKIKKSNPKKVLKISATFILSLEIIKFMYIMKTTGGIPSYMFPLQLCSFSLYTMPIIAFGTGKFSVFIRPFGYAIGLISGILVLVLPTTVLGSADFWIPFEGDVLPYISFFYHGNMIFFSLYLVLSKQYQPKFKEGIIAYGCLGFVALVAGLVNLYLQTDFMFLRTGNGNPVQFILTNYGYIPYILTMGVLGAVLIYGVFVTALIQPKKEKLVLKKEIQNC